MKLCTLKLKAASIVAIFLLSGCTKLPVKDIDLISLETIEQDEAKIPGKYALIIDSTKMHGTYHPTRATCSIYEFPYDVRTPYRNLLFETLKTSVSSIELIPSGQQFNESKYDATIYIETKDIITKFNIKEGIFTSDAIAFSSITSSTVVKVRNSTPTQDIFNSTRNYRAPLGYACSKVHEAMKVSIEHSSHESALAILKFVKRTLNSDILSKAITSTITPN